MPHGPNTIASIVELGAGTVQALRERGSLSGDLLQALERFCQEERAESDPFYRTVEGLEERLGFRLEDPILRSLEPRQALVCEIPEPEDFTLYVRRGAGEDVIAKLLGKLDTSADGELWLWDAVASRAAHGRVLACSCSRGREWSITVRRQQEYPERGQKPNHFNKWDDFVKVLGSILLEKGNPDKHGLVVISGRTGSGKSQIARKLIQHYLRLPSRGGRAPHLVSFEDPIEKEFRQAGVDVTQRQYPIDAWSLSEVLKNALRQTPRMLYVGETRNARDWEELLEFAGTGHLVFTTAHAGSLVEAVGNILQETKASTPATRSIVADRLLAVVHLRNATEPSTGVGFLIPAIWHRTPLGIKALMAEGLSSLLPNTPRPSSAGSATHLPGSVGRYWFARELAELAKQADGSRFPEEVKSQIRRRALEWDLEGL